MIGDLRVHARSRMVSRLAASLAAGRPVVLAVIAYAPCQNRHLSFAGITNQTYPVEQEQQPVSRSPTMNRDGSHAAGRSFGPGAQHLPNRLEFGGGGGHERPSEEASGHPKLTAPDP
jgi:hypothetical protein